jgi:hypothetical protein
MDDEKPIDDQWLFSLNELGEAVAKGYCGGFVAGVLVSGIVALGWWWLT